MSNRESRGKRASKKDENPFAELEELRRGSSNEDDYDNDDDDFGDAPAREERLFLGMTAVERMFLSIFFFMNIVVLGIAVLLLTGRLAL
ncbi:MAG: hypothetical protein SGI73_20870 [Chloroflexota bacterium]|nr:hypothetical protein [Chloroflexota bacterium]